MKKVIFAFVCIALGLTLILVSLPKRRYITLSGHADGRTWARRIAA